MITPTYLLDTNICAFYLRGKYNIDTFIDKVGWNNCCISEITAFELKIGAELSYQKNGRDVFEQLYSFLDDIQIYPITDVLDFAAKEKIRLRLEGTPCDDDFDLLIASTAIVNGMICVTENTKDFHRFKGITLENWVDR